MIANGGIGKHVTFLCRGRFRFGRFEMAVYKFYVPVRLSESHRRLLDRLAKERRSSRSEVLRAGLSVLAKESQDRQREEQK